MSTQQASDSSESGQDVLPVGLRTPSSVSSAATTSIGSKRRGRPTVKAQPEMTTVKNEDTNKTVGQRPSGSPAHPVLRSREIVKASSLVVPAPMKRKPLSSPAEELLPRKSYRIIGSNKMSSPNIQTASSIIEAGAHSSPQVSRKTTAQLQREAVVQKRNESAVGTSDANPVANAEDIVPVPTQQARMPPPAAKGASTPPRQQNMATRGSSNVTTPFSTDNNDFFVSEGTAHEEAMRSALANATGTKAGESSTAAQKSESFKPNAPVEKQTRTTRNTASNSKFVECPTAAVVREMTQIVAQSADKAAGLVSPTRKQQIPQGSATPAVAVVPIQHREIIKRFIPPGGRLSISGALTQTGIYKAVVEPKEEHDIIRPSSSSSLGSSSRETSIVESKTKTDAEKIEDLEKQIKELNQKNSQLESERDDVYLKNIEMNNLNDELLNKNDEMAQKVADTQKELDLTKRLAERMKIEFEASRGRLDMVGGEEKVRHTFRSPRKDKIEKDLEKAKKDIEKLTQMLDVKKEEAKKAKELEKTVARLETELKESQDQATANEQRAKDANQLRKTVALLEARLNSIPENDNGEKVAELQALLDKKEKDHAAETMKLHADYMEIMKALKK